MKILKIVKIISILFFVCLINISSLLAEQVLQKLEIKEGKTAFLYFSEIPSDFNTKLNDDKTSVIIQINNSKILENVSETHSAGLISDIYTLRESNGLKTIIQARSKTGYTAVPLPYSKTLMIDLFDWNKLNKTDDNYRSGLLAVEDGILSPAQKFLTLAAESGNPDAAAHLGIIQLYDGKLKSAFKNLIFAKKFHTKVPDTYAALAQVFKMYDIYDKASEYSTIFTKMTGLESFPEIAIGEIPPGDSLDNETIEMLLKINSFEETQNIAEDDSLKQRFNKALSKELNHDEDIGQTIFNSFFPDWFLDYLLYISLVVIIILIIILIAFLNWRKKQLITKDEKSISIRNYDFKDDLGKATKSMSLKSQAAQTYKNTETPDKEKQQNDKHDKPEDNIMKDSGNLTKAPKADIEVADIERIETDLVKDKDTKDSIRFEEKVDRIARQLIAAQKQQSLEQYEQDLESKNNNTDEGIDAKTKLARHLREQNLDTQQKTTEKKEKLPDDDKELSDIARKMKIAKGALETEKGISKISSDKKVLTELEKKFKGNEKE